MLNRRILRARAMQMLYAYHQAQSADYQFAQDSILKTFEAKAFLEGREDSILKANVEAANNLYHQINHKANFGSVQPTTPAASTSNPNPHIAQTAQKALELYDYQLQKDKSHLSRILISELEQIYDFYLLALSLVVQIADFVEADEEEKKLLHLPPPPAPEHTLKLSTNPIVVFLRENVLLSQALVRHNTHGEDTAEAVRHFYREVLQKDAVYLEYQALELASPEEHLAFARYLLKKQILLNSRFEPFFEGQCLDWAENLSTVRNMADKTLKNAAQNIPELATLSSDWQEDKAFVGTLFAQALGLQQHLDTLLEKHLKNWEVERLMLTDRVIMQLALCEFLNFSNIPVKVSINEYLEIAKIYGSLQSQQFINGLLDSIAEQLSQEGKIKKSGRGLMDNK